tara:strand:- start:1953 stop:3506 length:1554 start_codon:yes stop_codon:yes gene_type:complete
MPNVSLKVTDLENDYKSHVNVGLLQAPLFPDSSIVENIYLIGGWSMFSFNINILELDNWDYTNYPNVTMSSILQQFLYKYNENGDDYLLYDANNTQAFLDKVIIVKDNIGSAYLPQWNFDGLGTNLVSQGIPSQFQGYQIKMNHDIPGIYYIRLTGPYYEPTTVTTQDYPMRNGWNMIGVPFPECNVTAVEWCQNFVDKVIIMKDYAGAAYLPEWNFNGIGNMQIHWGYQLKLENHVNGENNLVVWKMGGGETGGNDPIDVNDDPVDDNVVIIDDTPTLADTNMTVKVPGNIIINVLPDLGIGSILDEKIRIINKHLGFDGGKSANEPVVVITQQKNEGKGSVKSSESTNVFMETLQAIINKNPGTGDPSGYSIPASRYINATWIYVKNEDKNPNSLLTGSPLENLIQFLKQKTTKFNFKFFGYNNNKQILVAKTTFNVVGLETKAIIPIAIQGDDSQTTIVEGLTSGEVPVIYFFSGEKYYLCNLTIESGTLQFSDKKEVNVTNIVFNEPVIDIFT